MANMIKHDSVSHAWLEALEFLSACTNRKASNLSIVISKPGVEDNSVRNVIDAVLEDGGGQTVNTVANTIFPQALYQPDKRGAEARNHLYTMSNKGYTYAKQLRANSCGRYIQRLIAYPTATGTINQLEQAVLRLQRETSRPNPLSSIYEISLTSLGEDIDTEKDIETGAGMQIIRPGYDNQPMGFPCLSYISLTLENKQLHLTALYRNQHFFRKAYGNYIGLSRLLDFFCREVGCEPGEIMCVATHADAELGKRDLAALIEKCRAAPPARV